MSASSLTAFARSGAGRAPAEPPLRQDLVACAAGPARPDAESGSASPDFIEVIDGALSPLLCADLIDAFERSPHLRPGRTGGGVDVEKKRSTDLDLTGHAEYRALVQQVAAAVSAQMAAYFRKYHFALIAPLALNVTDPVTGAPTALTHDNFQTHGAPRITALMQALYRIGPVQAQRYDAGVGHYAYWHCEVFPHAPHNEALHRSLLWMVYLNEVEQGGQTEFFYQRRAIQPRRGRMVIAPAYFTHTHRGCPPISGDKYILTSWVLLQRAEQLR